MRNVYEIAEGRQQESKEEEREKEASFKLIKKTNQELVPKADGGKKREAPVL